MDQRVNKQLIQKYLNGECNSTELQIMNDFMRREDAQQLIDQVWAEEWDGFKEEEISDKEIAGWKNLIEERLPKTPTPVKKLSPGKRFLSLPYAAIWAGLILGIGTWYGIANLKKQQEKGVVITMLESVNPMGQRSKIRLPDSSIVYLAGGSKLTHPERFTGNTREITLQGEAFFEITKNPKKPFIIHTGNVQTRVLGTSFRINAFTGNPFVLEVATGKVRVSQLSPRGEKSLAVLTPGQSLKWENSKAILGSVAVDDVKEWKNGRLVFNGATLQEITTVLERCYNVKTVFTHPAKARQHITITLTANVPLTEIMDVLAGTGKFRYQFKGSQITIN